MKNKIKIKKYKKNTKKRKKTKKNIENACIDKENIV